MEHLRDECSFFLNTFLNTYVKYQESVPRERALEHFSMVLSLALWRLQSVVVFRQGEVALTARPCILVSWRISRKTSNLSGGRRESDWGLRRSPEEDCGCSKDGNYEQIHPMQETLVV